MKDEPKKSKHAPGPYDFCPKHGVFFASCGCEWQKKKKVDVEIEPEKSNDIHPKQGTLDGDNKLEGENNSR